jgi:hypothetical protein
MTCLADLLEKLRPRLGLGRAFDSQDHTLEVNLAAYGLGLIAAACWLTWWFYTGPRDGNLVLAFSAFLTAITGGLFKKGSNAPEPPKGDQP